MTAQEIISEILRQSGFSEPLDFPTCDRMIAGDAGRDVKRILCTFMATAGVIRTAIDRNADMIITHEPTWFSGSDETGWLTGDPVYDRKQKLLRDSGLVIWRYHDTMHGAKGGDRIYQGVDLQFGWGGYRMENQGFPGICYEIPETSLEKLCGFFREMTGMKTIRMIGSPEMTVRKAAVLVGGGSLGLGDETSPMKLMRDLDIDVAICGDITEWTLPAYIRDASQLGLNKAAIILGHERSEECGMRFLVPWLREIMPGVEIEFADAGEPFQYL